MDYIILLARILFSQIFIINGFSHFHPQAAQYAASHNVPFAEILVPVSGLMAILGGLSILTGFKAKIGAVLIVLFLVPVTMMMHNFWTIKDPMQHATQKTMFMKNLSMLGGALFIAAYGSGNLSIDKIFLRKSS